MTLPPALGDDSYMPAGPTGEPGVEISHVSKLFAGQRALDDVNLTLVVGQVHALVGQNGSGKSTLIKILAGYHQPDGPAAVLVGGKPLPFGDPRASRQAGLRFVHQNLGLIDQLSAVENTALTNGYARRAGPRIDWPRQVRHTEELLARIGVRLDVLAPVGSLRAVERAALAIARAIDDTAGQIRLLVLDEPTAALPASEVAQLFRLVREIRAQRIAVLYVSHRLPEVLELADRISVLRDGALTATVDPSAVDRSTLVQLIAGRAVSAPQRGDAANRHPVPRSAAATALRVRGLRASGLSPTNLDIERTEVVGLAGLLGSGREVVPYALFGAEAARFDILAVGGTRLTRNSPRTTIRAGLALVPGNRQRGSGIAQMTMRENLTLPTLHRFSWWGGVHGARERAGVLEWVERLDIRPAAPEQLFAHFSGGNQQKILLAKWLHARPQVLMLDEPTAGVDVAARAAIHAIVRESARDGIAFLISSADFEDFEAMCDRVIVFSRGRVIGELRGEEIRESRFLELINNNSPG